MRITSAKFYLQEFEYVRVNAYEISYKISLQ
jgi:hypothetical protein